MKEKEYIAESKLTELKRIHEEDLQRMKIKHDSGVLQLAKDLTAELYSLEEQIETVSSYLIRLLF